MYCTYIVGKYDTPLPNLILPVYTEQAEITRNIKYLNSH
jgi:hypothetical protein